MNDALVDRISGGLGMLLAACYIANAQSIEDSLLADAVGASGVPTGVGVVLLIASLFLFVKSFKSKASMLNETEEEPIEGGSQHPHAMALGLLLILVAYVFLLPILGYVLSIGLLVGAAAWFAGARAYTSLALCAVLAGPLLWFVFDWTLEIRLPVGLWPMWLGK
jgi:putative tricarboxylic transport membrane protein